MPENVRALFDAYAGAYVRGEHPQARDYLARAGDRAEELGRLLNSFLGLAPRPSADPDSLVLVSAWAEGEPPLVHLRASHGVRVDDVVDAIVEDAELTAAKRPKVKRYYQRLEQGLLDPSGVSEPVWNVVRRLIGPAAEVAATWRVEPVAPAPTLFRTTLSKLDEPEGAISAARQLIPERDEVDELFTNRR